MRTQINRREFLKNAAAVGLAAAWPGRLRSEDAAVGEQGAFSFIAVNDLHFKDPKLCPPWFERTFKAMRESAPKAEFVLVSGDLASDALKEEFAGMREAFESLKLPVYVTCGNHDMTDDGGHELYDKYFPGRYHYAFEHRGWQFFGFNTADGRHAEKVSIRPSAFTWIDENLKRFDPRKPSVIFTHFPQVPCADESHNKGPGVLRCSVNREIFLGRFESFNLQAILSGHWHGRSETMRGDASVTTNRCCSRSRGNHDGSTDKSWWVCEARDGRVTRRFETVPA